MTDVSVEFEVKGQYDILQSPPILPPIYNGEKLVLYAILKPRDSVDEAPLEGTVILKGKIPGKEICHSLSFTVDTTAKDPSPSTTVHHLAAKALVKDWQNERKSKDEIIKLSIEASVISAHTAFIAVDEESSECISAPMKTWDIQAAPASYPGSSYSASAMQPLQQQVRVQACRMSMESNIDEVLSRGDKLDALECKTASLSDEAVMFNRTATKSKGGFSLGSFFSGLFGSSKSSPPPAASRKKEAAFVMGSDSLCEAFEDEESDDEMGYTLCSSDLGADENISTLIEEEKESLAQPSPSRADLSLTLSSVIKAQQANGSWKLDSTLAQLLKKTAKELEEGSPTEVKGSMASIWATILVLSLLKKEFSSQQEEWELIAMKAESWLGKQALPSGVSKANLVAAADKLL